MVWFLGAFPVLVGFVLIDFVWFIRRLRRGQSLQPLLLAGVLWVAVLRVDRLLS